jgi:hypothetical protein
MIKNVLIFLMLFEFAFGQRIQAGFGLSANNTFYHHGSSVYFYSQNFGTGISPGFGISSHINFGLTESWSIRSGLAYHFKRYRVMIRDYTIKEVDGYFYFDAGFHSLEVPLLISYKTPKEKKYKFEYRAGIVSSFYIPATITTGYSMEFTGPAAFVVGTTPMPDEQTYSPDIYIGVSLLRMNDKMRRQEFTISYQYGLLPTMRYDLNAAISVPGQNTIYSAILRPTLSSFMLSYAFYPRWLNFGSNGE